MNFKRGKPKQQVRCTLCTNVRWLGNAAERIKGRAARHTNPYVDGLPDMPTKPGTTRYDFCPDCDGTGRCECEQCVEEKIGCLYCQGSGIVAD